MSEAANERCVSCGALLSLVGVRHLCRPVLVKGEPVVIRTVDLPSDRAGASRKGGLPAGSPVARVVGVDRHEPAARSIETTEPPSYAQNGYRDVVKRRVYMREYMRKRRAR